MLRLKKLIVPAAMAFAAASQMTHALAGGDTIKIGVLHPTSGPLSILGDGPDKAWKLIFEKSSKEGLAGRKVEAKVYDTEGNAPKAVALYKRLVEDDEVDVIFGPLTSGEGTAVVAAANEMKVPTFVYGTAEAMTNPLTKYVFGLTPIDRVVVGSLLASMQGRQIKRASLIYSLDAYGQSAAPVIKELAPKYGVELVTVETVAPNDTNVQPQLLHLRAANVDAHILWSTANPVPTIILKTAKQLGITQPFFMAHGNVSAAFLAQSGGAAEGVIAPGFPIFALDALPDSYPAKSLLLDFNKAYRSRWNAGPEPLSGIPFDAKIIVEEALKKISGPITRDNLRDAIETVSMCGSWGCRKFSAQDHRGTDVSASMRVQAQGDKWVVVP